MISEFKYDGKYMCTLFSLNTYDFIGKIITFISKSKCKDTSKTNYECNQESKDQKVSLDFELF